METLTPVDITLIENQATEALRMCYDPEIPVNIYELGLVYGVAVNQEGHVVVTMTLTSPHCPVAQTLPREVEARLKTIPKVTDATVKVVWEPPWHTGLMSEAAKLELGF